MPRLIRLRLSVLDLAILVAALTPGLAVARSLTSFIAYQQTLMMITGYSTSPSRSETSYLEWKAPGTNHRLDGRPLDRRPSYWLMRLPYYGGPCLLSATLATLVLGMIDFRRRGREALRQPGLIAAVSVALAASFAVVDAERICLTLPREELTLEGINQILVNAWFILPRLAGALVGAAWLALALGGCWGGEPAGRERIRLLLGAAWIAAGAACQLGIWCQDFNL